VTVCGAPRSRCRQATESRRGKAAPGADRLVGFTVLKPLLRKKVGGCGGRDPLRVGPLVDLKRPAESYFDD
jgi:hypothetical protein